MSSLRGLTKAEVEERIRKYGLNVVPEKKESLLKLFLKKFTGLTPYTIEAAAVISFVLGRYVDFAVMVALLLVNAVIGIIHEHRAEKAVELLKSKLRVVVRALRDGEWTDVPAEYVVPDDIVKLKLGDVVPADGELVTGHLIVDESALTGESFPVDKNPGDKVYAGSTVLRGEGVVRVSATGASTRYGKTVELVQVSKPRLIIEEITASITKGLLVADIFFILLVAVKLIMSRTSFLDLLPFTLTLLIASIPIALPAMTTITLALGSVELAKAGVIVRRLEAIEAGSMMDVICLDKTGTITENRITVREVVPLSSEYSEREVLLYALLASEEDSKDPIDRAVIEAAKQKGVSKQGVEVLEFKPFSPETKRTEAIARVNGVEVRTVKGAPQVLAEMDKDLDKSRYEALIKEMSSKGERPLAVGVEKSGVFKVVGLIGLYDKPRDDSPLFIKEIKEMGVKPIMITGDNVYVAKTISEVVGIGGRVVTLKGVPREEIPSLVEDIDAFAEVIPEEKHDIVVALQKKEHVVGMTGDGVNDAPALKRADLGVAVSNATDIAKLSASVVLTKPGLRNIVDIIKLGRMVYRRIVVWSLNKVVKTFQIVYFVAISTLFLGLPVLTPTHMILMLFLYDFVTLSISTDRLKPSRKPERWNIRKLVTVSVVLGFIKILELFLALYIALDYLALPLDQTRTFVFYVLLLSGLFNILNFRETNWFWSSKPSLPVSLSIVGDIIVGTILVYQGWVIPAIPLYAISVGFLYSVAVTLMLTDAAKIMVFRFFGAV
ncbi:H+-transporting ATPase related protein [Desulfurococcus amylolyticus 1221n]|uniref:H+-transporting ATPase related protein n=1 Tax=Desulfurococcus amylolyticus (strain DSM 18924 / JCM 16383 / VKM B-2413 / 1221n) TaxID=490899 RepID=B8D5Z6_DESA1|nr:plasma-membrane proton-efflux P-type ATPase [Desulfurococcus amylolyticus]ACL11527.1 H+-transporting ATPase related protein [Desulfurococcus amylolyticus 1221n]